MKIRSFLAFELPPEIKGVLSRVSEEMRRSLPDLKWVKIEGIHLTVVFLGYVEEEAIGPLGAQAGSVCEGYGPFRLLLQGAGVFPNARRPNVLWAGLDGDLERLAAFRDELQEALVPFGIKEEKRRFRPHLTLARFRKGGGERRRLEELLERYGDLSSPVWRLEEMVLFKSDLKPVGAVYTRLKAWPLTGEK